MKSLSKVISFYFCAVAMFSCSASKDTKWLDNAVETAHYQVLAQLEEIKNYPENKCFARTVKNDTLIATNAYDWTSGFPAGTLWKAYELTKDENLAVEARKYTNRLEPIKNYKGTHDLGFMVFCSYGEAYRLKPEAADKDVIITAAESLSSRYNSDIRAIKSWDWSSWNFPVIIDNMMNLEMLFWASQESGNKVFQDIAEAHANTTLENHFRPENSTSYHVVSYNNDGTVEEKCTHQGYADDSAWARGQAWGLYGYVVCYRYTQNPKYLEQAEKIAKFIMENRPSENDYIPYWDYNAPDIPKSPRDVSASTITASALIEMQGYAENGEKYLDFAENILKQLSTAEYLAEKGTNHGFILKHSVGHLPGGIEIDVPLNYADYYFLEAISRYKSLQEK